MSNYGIHFSLAEAQASKLSIFHSTAELVDSIETDFSIASEFEWKVDSGLAWDAIHRVLGDGTLSAKGKTLREKCILGGKQISRSPQWILSFLEAAEVPEIANDLLHVNEEWFSKRYFSLQKQFLGITFSSYDGPVDEDDFLYSWNAFLKIRNLFTISAQHHRAMLFIASQ